MAALFVYLSATLLLTCVMRKSIAKTGWMFTSFVGVLQGYMIYHIFSGGQPSMIIDPLYVVCMMGGTVYTVVLKGIARAI